MISTRPGSFAALAAVEVRRYPGELSDRRLTYGRICVAEQLQVGIPAPTRWVERMREAGLLAPARVRRMPHITIERLARHALSEQERRVMLALLVAGNGGLAVDELAIAEEPSGALRETLADLYRAGLASPPAALWPAVEGTCAQSG